MIRTMSILIAEDNVAQRHYLKEILEKEFPSHAPVVEAADGEETVKLALDGKPELCILDIQMPKLSGVKAARAIWRWEVVTEGLCRGGRQGIAGPDGNEGNGTFPQ